MDRPITFVDCKLKLKNHIRYKWKMNLWYNEQLTLQVKIIILEIKCFANSLTCSRFVGRVWREDGDVPIFAVSVWGHDQDIQIQNRGLRAITNNDSDLSEVSQPQRDSYIYCWWNLEETRLRSSSWVWICLIIN